MIKRLLRLILEICVISIALVAVVLFYVSHHVDTVEFRQQFTNAIGKVVGNPVVLEGELNIALYPALSLEVLDLALEDAAKVSDKPLARFDRLLVNVRLIPLMSRRVDIESIIVEGMDINIVQSESGTVNWGELAGRPQPDISTGFGGEEQLAGISLSELDVKDATIIYDDLKSGQIWSLRGVTFRTGAIVPGDPIPFSAKSRFAWNDDFIQSEIILKGIVESDENHNLTLREGSISATFDGSILPDGEEPGELAAKILMDWDKKTVALENLRFHFLGLRADGKLKSTDLTKEFKSTGHITVKPFKPRDLITHYFPDASLDSVDGLDSAALATSIQIDESGIALKSLVASLDDLTVRGSVSTHGFADPYLSFGLRGGMVNIDKYLPLFASDEPFYWEDFNLSFWGGLRGKGTVRVDGLTLYGTAISDIRLDINADGKKLIFDAGAIRKGQGSLGGKAEFCIGKNAESKQTTLGIDMELTAESQKDGFAFLNQKPLNISGKGTIDAQINVKTINCPDKGRSIEILRALSGRVGLKLGKGAGRYVDELESYSLEYDAVEGGVRFSPLRSKKDGYYAYSIDSTLKGRGKGKVRKFNMSAKGPLVTAVDELHLTSAGLRSDVRVSGPMIVKSTSHVHATGKVGFDSKKKWVKIASGSLKALDATLNGNVRVTNLNKNFKAQGDLDLRHADIKRIVYLLTKYDLKTEDPAALTAVSGISQFTADKNGFKLTALEGKLDGMSFSGQVSGDGFLDPLLTFSLSAGIFDLDRYLPPSDKRNENLKPGETPKRPSHVELPLPILRWLNFDGKAWFEEFKLVDIRTQNVSGLVQAKKGKINVSKMSGDIYGGKIAGEWKGLVGKRRLSTHLKLYIKGMKAGPFMQDIAERDYVRGRTDATIDLTSAGATDEAILGNLAGEVSGLVKDGSFKFTGYDYKPPKVDPGNEKMFNDKHADLSKRRTLFSKAAAKFTVRKGVFIVDKSRLDSPLLTSTGKGTINLPARSINLSVRNDFVALPSVPMVISGHLSNPQIRFPKTKILSDTVKNILSLPEKSFHFFTDLF